LIDIAMNNPEMRFALIGHPLTHSFSASWFNNRFANAGLDAIYENIDIEDVTELRHIVTEKGLCGMNITSPHKTAVMPMLDALTPEAQAIGAVNAIIVERDDNNPPRLIGHNTDCLGFKQALEPLLPHNKTLTAIVAGATGGAAKAVMYALNTLGISATGLSRAKSRGYISYSDITPEIINHTDIIINSTPLGMHPHEGEAPPLPYHLIGPHHLCYDLIYNPAETEFLHLCRMQGAITSNGLQMLLNQALLSWRFFHLP